MAAQQCLDGCGAFPKRGRFLPGHDARLASAIERGAALPRTKEARSWIADYRKRNAA